MYYAVILFNMPTGRILVALQSNLMCLNIICLNRTTYDFDELIISHQL